MYTLTRVLRLSIRRGLLMRLAAAAAVALRHAALPACSAPPPPSPLSPASEAVAVVGLPAEQNQRQ